MSLRQGRPRAAQHPRHPHAASTSTRSCCARPRAGPPTRPPARVAADGQGFAAGTGPEVRVLHDRHTAVDATVTDATKPFWLVFGESLDEGWHLRVNGKDQGPATLVNGYAHGWLVNPGAKTTLDVDPAVDPAAGHLGGHRHLRGRAARLPRARALADAPPPRTRGRGGRVRTARPTATPACPCPSTSAAWCATPAPHPRHGRPCSSPSAPRCSGASSSAPSSGSRSGSRWPSPPGWPAPVRCFTLGAPLLLLLVAAYIIVEQYRWNLPAGFEWPGYYAGTHQFAWASVALMATDVLIDRLWLRRWWPTEDSPA